MNTPIATATSRVCVRLRFLRQKLIEDLRDGGKIFVYKNNHRTLSDDELAGLHAAVRRYGDNTLLYVRVADAAHPNRSVAWAGPGLLVGAIEHFTHSPLPEDTFLGLATASWMEICQVAHGMWTKARLPSAQR